MSVSYIHAEPRLGRPPLNVTLDTTLRCDVGSRALGLDQSTSAYGEAEFEYCKFTGTVAAGDFVLFNQKAKTCVALPTSATKGRVGIAMAAQTSGSYGWVMVRGVHDGANVATASFATPTALTGSGTAGRATTGTSSYLLEGVMAEADSASNVGPVSLQYPFSAGR